MPLTGRWLITLEREDMPSSYLVGGWGGLRRLSELRLELRCDRGQLLSIMSNYDIHVGLVGGRPLVSFRLAWGQTENLQEYNLITSFPTAGRRKSKKWFVEYPGSNIASSGLAANDRE